MTAAAAGKTAYETVIGLEVHCQLKTASKLFCACPARSFELPANTNVCPVCTGQPGALPVLNGAAVGLAFKAALALGLELRSTSIFARKNYFYPDLPKDYQISQYEEPFSEHGVLALPGGREIGIHRIHMEEDAGKLVHAIGSEELPYSLVDFNRGGVPLIEIVSEPEMKSSQEAYEYLSELKAILQYLDVSNCDMEKGEMRCDANVSLKPVGRKELGQKVEIKNLNSFKAVRDAIEHEVFRQAGELDAGARIRQETRLWDEKAQRTEPMRSKEEAHDYRYFPDPDLVPLEAATDLVARLKTELPELPRARRARLISAYGLSDYDAGVLTAERALADYYEAAVKVGAPAKPVANWITTELLGKLNAEGKALRDCPVPAAALGELAALIEKGTLSTKLAKEVFAKMWTDGKRPGELVQSLGLVQVSDSGQIREWAQAAVAQNPKAVADYKSGNERALGALVGSVMKQSKGKANPALVNDVLKEILKG